MPSITFDLFGETNPSPSSGKTSSESSTRATTPSGASWEQLWVWTFRSQPLPKTVSQQQAELWVPRDTQLGGSSTLNISECPNDAVESLLSQVLETRGGVDPAEILFERPGVQGDFSESRAQGQGSASGTVGGAPSDDSGPVQTLVAGYSKSYNSLQELDKLQISAFRESSFGGYEQDKVSSTLKAVGGVLSGGSETFVAQKDNTPPQGVTKESSEH